MDREQTNNRSLQSCTAFALLELLVTVAVIGVLAAIVVPTFQNYVKQAQGQPGQFSIRYDDSPGRSSEPLIDSVNVGAMTTNIVNAYQQTLKHRLASAMAVFNTPKEIALADTKTIKLVISLRKTESQLTPEVQQYGESRAAKIDVGSSMQALLVSNDQDGLSVVSKTPNPQDLSTTEDTYWLWDVKAKKSGSYKLTLTIAIDSDINGVRLQRAIKTHEEDIVVDITIWKMITDFFGENWQWLWAALVVPVAGYIWKRWKVKRKKAHTIKPTNEPQNDG